MLADFATVALTCYALRAKVGWPASSLTGGRDMGVGRRRQRPACPSSMSTSGCAMTRASPCWPRQPWSCASTTPRRRLRLVRGPWALWHAMHTFAGTRRWSKLLCSCTRYIGCRTVNKVRWWCGSLSTWHSSMPIWLRQRVHLCFVAPDPAVPRARPGMLAVGLPAALGRKRLPAAAQRRRRLVCGGRHSGQHVPPGL